MYEVPIPKNNLDSPNTNNLYSSKVSHSNSSHYSHSPDVKNTKIPSNQRKSSVNSDYSNNNDESTPKTQAPKDLPVKRYPSRVRNQPKRYGYDGTKMEGNVCQYMNDLYNEQFYIFSIIFTK